jgi:hypothetical protein
MSIIFNKQSNKIRPLELDINHPDNIIDIGDPQRITLKLPNSIRNVKNIVFKNIITSNNYLRLGSSKEDYKITFTLIIPVWKADANESIYDNNTGIQTQYEEQYTLNLREFNYNARTLTKNMNEILINLSSKNNKSPFEEIMSVLRFKIDRNGLINMTGEFVENNFYNLWKTIRGNNLLKNSDNSNVNPNQGFIKYVKIYVSSENNLNPDARDGTKLVGFMGYKFSEKGEDLSLYTYNKTVRSVLLSKFGFTTFSAGALPRDGINYHYKDYDRGIINVINEESVSLNINNVMYICSDDIYNDENMSYYMSDQRTNIIYRVPITTVTDEIYYYENKEFSNLVNYGRDMSSFTVYILDEQFRPILYNRFDKLLITFLIELE